MQKIFSTSFPFPIIKLNTLIDYSEVKKPTGISYILLVLINESVSKKDNFSELLKQFGVPSDLHGIFAQEVEKLLELEIIKMTHGHEYNRRYFEDYVIGDFEFTLKGKKIFAEEAIPTDKVLEKKQELWFDPVRKELKVKLAERAGRIGQSILPEELCKQFHYTNIQDLEMFIDANKGRDIEIKKEDIVTKINIINQDYMFVTYPIQLMINDNSEIEVSFDEKKILEFYQTYYDANYLTNGLKLKTKFKFKDYHPQIMDLKNISNITNILLPEGLKEIVNKKDILAITKGLFTLPNSKYAFNNREIFSKLEPNIEFILVDKLKNAKAYLPVTAKLLEKHFGYETYVNLLIEKELRDAELSQIIVTIIGSELREFSRDNVQILFDLTSLINNNELLLKTLDSYLSSEIETNIIRLKDINTVLSKIKEVRTFISQKAHIYYNEYYKDVSHDNIKHKYSIGNWMIKLLNISQIDFIKKVLLSLNTENENAKLSTYSLLESMSLSADDILVFINVIDIYLTKSVNNQKINTNESKLALIFENLQSNLNELKSITGISNLTQFNLNNNLNHDSFQKSFKQFVNIINDLKKYEKYSVESFKLLSSYYDLFVKINDLINEEKNALLKPDKITRKFIEDKVINGDYMSAIIRLTVKLESLLKKRLDSDTTLYELLNTAYMEKCLDKKEMNQLHELREVRNNVVHFVDHSIDVKKSDVTIWINLVYELEGRWKDESRSKN